MKRIHAVAIVTVTAAITLGISTVANSSGRQLANLKQPAATAANIRGLKLVYGRAVTAGTAASNFGVAPLVYSVARCPRGTHAISGGWNSSDTTNDPVTISSNEAGKNDALWLVAAHDTSTDATSPGFTFQATAVCG